MHKAIMQKVRDANPCVKNIKFSSFRLKAIMHKAIMQKAIDAKFTPNTLIAHN